MGEPLLLPGETRRSFMKRGLVGGALLLVGGGAALHLRRSRLRTPATPLQVLSVAEYSVLAAIADRLIPAGNGFPPAAQMRCAEKADAVLVRAHPGVLAELKQLIALFESALAGLLFDGRPTPFTQLDPEAQDRALLAWRNSRIAIRRTGYKALRNLLSATYYASPEAYAAVGYPGPPEIVRPEGSP